MYRDTEGKPIRQFDYPSDDICRKVQAVAGSQARCTNDSVSDTMKAQAVLRYVPPGITVPSHYANMNRCAVDTREPSRVLAAMGALTHGNVRLSLTRGTTAADVGRFLDVLPGVVADLRAEVAL